MTGAFLLDSHIHLSDPEYQPYVDHILSSMERLNLKACCVSVDHDTCKTTLNLAKKSNRIYPFVGIHPETVSSSSEPSSLNPSNNSPQDLLPLTESFIEKNKESISGIGEIGLDKTYVSSDEGFQKQISVFEHLLKTAERLQKPVSIHSRTTLDKIIEMLPSYSIPGVLLHWFDGNKKQLRQIMDYGYYVSFGLATLYSKDKQVLFTKANHDLVLVETDGPVRFSHAFSYRPAQVAFLPSLVHRLCIVSKKGYDNLLSMLENNSKKYLGI